MRCRNGANSRLLRTGAAVALMVLARAAVWAQIAAPNVVGTAEVRGTITAANGSMTLAGATIECTDGAGRVVVTLSDAAGRFRLPNLPVGTYQLKVSLAGFREAAEPITVVGGQILDWKRDLQLAGVRETVLVVAERRLPGDAATTVGATESLPSTAIAALPLRDGSVRAALVLLPGVIQSRDGLSIRGGLPAQSSFQLGAASATEPSSGETFIRLPADAVDAIEVLPNPFAVEFGRFSSGVTVARTRAGGSAWHATIQDVDPTFRRRRNAFGIAGIESFAPRIFFGGPLLADRVFVAESVQYSYGSYDVRSRPQSETSVQHQAALFSRVDVKFGDDRSVAATFGAFPAVLRSFNLDTFNPPEVAANWRQHIYVGGLTHRAAPSPTSFLETSLHANRYDLVIDGNGDAPMIVAPELNRGSYYHTQNRTTTSLQFLGAFSRLAQGLGGDHVLKVGTDVQVVGYDGTSRSRPVELLREGGTLAQAITFGQASSQRVRGTEVAFFGQDRWQLDSRTLIEFGARADRDAVLRRLNLAPRAGAALSLRADGGMTIRGGIGMFYGRTPSAAGAFDANEARAITRFLADGETPSAPAITFTPATAPDLMTARSRTWSLEYEQRVWRHITVRAGVLDRCGARELIVAPEGAADETGRALLLLASNGRSRYRDASISARWAPRTDRELTVSYVRSSARADLNAYSVVTGLAPDPFVRPDSYAPMETDVPHRLLARMLAGIGSRIRIYGAMEVRNGAPYSAVDDQQDFVGPRNQSLSFPLVARADLAVERRFTIAGWHPWIGVRVWNAFNAFTPRDVQRNIGSPSFGSFYSGSPREIHLSLRLER